MFFIMSHLMRFKFTEKKRRKLYASDMPFVFLRIKKGDF